MLYKSVKYSYFWSFSEFGEENKMCLKLNLTGMTHCRIILCKKGAKLQGPYISPPNILK